MQRTESDRTVLKYLLCLFLGEIGLVFINIKTLNINASLNCVSTSDLSLEHDCPWARVGPYSHLQDTQLEEVVIT